MIMSLSGPQDQSISFLQTIWYCLRSFAEQVLRHLRERFSIACERGGMKNENQRSKDAMLNHTPQTQVCVACNK